MQSPARYDMMRRQNKLPCMNNKMIFGALITPAGLVFAALSFLYAATHPWDWNGIGGLVICFVEAYRGNR